MLRKTLAGVAALSMIATPALARPVAPNPAAKLSVVKVPAGARSAAMQGDSKLRGGRLAAAIVGGVAAVVLIILIAGGDDDSDSP